MAVDAVSSEPVSAITHESLDNSCISILRPPFSVIWASSTGGKLAVTMT